MTDMALTVAIALGSNLDDRYSLLQSARTAIAALDGVTVRRATAVEETVAIGPPQPAYLNQMLLVDCTRSLPALLTDLQAIETTHGRVRALSKGPRTLDLDIVHACDVAITSGELLVPHPGLLDRDFWQRELAELIGVAAAADAIAMAQLHAGMDTAGQHAAHSAPHWSGAWDTVA